MRSKAIVCWRGWLKPIGCGQAFRRLRVPGDLRQRDCVLPVDRSIGPAAQQARVADAASGERDRAHFDN